MRTVPINRNLVFGGGVNSDGLTGNELDEMYNLLGTNKRVSVGFSASTIEVAISWLKPCQNRPDCNFLMSPQLSANRLWAIIQEANIDPNEVIIVETEGDLMAPWGDEYANNINSDGQLKWNYVKIISGPGITPDSNSFTRHGMPWQGLLNGGVYTVEVNGIRKTGTLAEIYGDLIKR